MKKLFLLAFLFSSQFFMAQVGINTTNPNAQLDIQSTSQAAPSNTDGILIPKMDVFPAVNPTAAQQGMLVYLTTATTFSGNPKPIGFYYWNDSPADWIAVKGTDGGTLDQAYDFGGAGLGRIITADTGAVTINGTDGLVSTGTSGSGVVVPSGAGTRMLWNPRKSAFRAGEVGGTEWDDFNLGQSSMAFGASTRASGQASAAWGVNSIAAGSRSTTWGFNNISNGQAATSFGESNIAVNDLGTVWGRTNVARGTLSTAWGVGTEAGSFAETVFGTFPTILPLLAINNLFGSNNADRLFVVGNGFSAGSRSDAFVIMKSGRIGIGTNNPADRLHVVGNIRMVDGNQDTGKVLTSDASGTATWQTPAAAGTTLDGAYDFGGAGLGKTITADNGAVTIAGFDGVVSTGTSGIGVVAPSGAGTRMVWNPNKSAFRVGTVSGVVSGLNWDNINIGQGSVAMGTNTRASGSDALAIGNNAVAQGNTSTAFGNATSAIGNNSFAVGNTTLASNTASTAMGSLTTASGTNSFAMGLSSTASGPSSVAMGNSTLASGGTATALGGSTVASGTLSTAMGFSTTAAGENTIATGTSNTASSFGESAFGIGATTYTPSVNGATQFQAANVTDRLLVVGNALDANSNFIVDAAERSDALVILKNGLTRLPSTTNAMITAADGKAVVTKEFLQSNTSGTLDQAYDFGGAGVGKTITADAGAVTIDGTDGLVSTGTTGSGAIVPSGDGTRMVWNPNKAAFRAGTLTSGTGMWDDTSIGVGSVAMGRNTFASGDFSVAVGDNNRALGVGSIAFGTNTYADFPNSTAFGNNTQAANGSATAMGTNTRAYGGSSTAMGFSTFANNFAATSMGSLTVASGFKSTAIGDTTTASGDVSTAIGEFTTASGLVATALGSRTIASGSYSTSMGLGNSSLSFGETVLGIGATTYTPSVNGTTQFRAANITDRLLVVGNALDANNNGIVDAPERSDALVILKNGNTGIGSSNPAEKLVVAGNIRNTALAGVGNRLVASNGTGNLISMASGTNGQVMTQTGAGPVFQTLPPSGCTLDQGYDFGGAGLGRTITADTGAVTIDGTDGLVSTGTVGSGAVAPSGAGTRMVWNPNKAAFRAGNVAGTQWNDANIGSRSTAFGSSTTASGVVSTAFGAFTTASGDISTAFGFFNTAPSYGETVLGIGATTYTASANGATEFRATNVTDRLLVVGNAIDANNNNLVDVAERRDAMVILKNGNTGIGASIPQDKLHVVGNIRMVDGNQAAGRVLTSDANGTATWTDASATAWGLLGNSAVNAATNFMGSTNDADVVFRRFNVRAGVIGTTNTSLGTNSLDVASTGTNNTAIGVDALNGISTGTNNTAVGFNTLAAVNSGTFNTAIGAQATVTSAIFTNATAIGSRATAGNSNVVILGSINGVNGATSSVNVGIGTNNPNSALEIVDASVVTSGTVEGNLNVASNDPQNTDIGASITLSGIASGGVQRVFASVEGRKSNAGAASDSGYLAFKTNNVGTLTEKMRITNIGNVGIGTAAPGGQFELSLDQGRKPGTNTWTIVSDQRLKTVNGNYTKGLNEILQLKPVRYNYKNSGIRTFEKEVLDTEFAGFLAQEVQPLFPEAVGIDGDGFLNFNIHPILIASVNALKELSAKNDQLEQKSSQLEKENRSLKESVQAINDKMLLIIAEMEKLKK